MKMMIVFGIILHVSRQASAVEMLEGQSVLLFCEFPTDDMDRPTVEWSRSDLSPSTVHQRQQEGDQLMDQNQLYRGRTSMKTDALETGDLSLNLTNLQTSDTGTYSCSVRSDRGKQRVRSEELLVKKLSSSWTKQLPVLLVLILTVVNVASALFYYFRHRLFSETKMELEKEKVEVISGEESILLPCKIADRLPKDVKVKWRDGSNRMVHWYQNGSDQPRKQNQRYRTRTNIGADLRKTGDLSLTLTSPTDGDRNIYTCSASSWIRNILWTKQVQLEVKAQQVEVEEGAESVLLPFRVPTDRLGGDTVEWRRSYPEPVMKVHVFQNGSDQPGEQNQVYRTRTKMHDNLMKTGDLSLTLTRPTDGDTGEYRCIVLREAIPVRVKCFHLNVKAGTVQVQVQSEDIGARSSSAELIPLLADESV